MSTSWQRPRPHVYEYNYQIQSGYYRPTIESLNKGKKEPESKIFAERIKTYPLYGGVYPDHPEEDVPDVRRGSQPPQEDGCQSSCRGPESKRDHRASSVPSKYDRVFDKNSEDALKAAKAKLQELEEMDFPVRQPIWLKHPYYLPVDSEMVPPHEGSVWPESRPHFDLVSSYDLMVGYLGIRSMAANEAAKHSKSHQ